MLALLIALGGVAAGAPPQPAPPYPVVTPPPPLSPAMRVLYAPFYGAGLVLRYGVYYVIVAPLEVFGRALDYGVEGGVAPAGNGDAAARRGD